MTNDVRTDRFVDARDGIRLAVRDHGGDGPDLLLLHGAGSHLLSRFNLARKFGDGFRVVTMDARWSGQSGDAERYDWDDLVADVEAVVEQLRMERPVIGGHSWGGIIAAYYGAAHPEARGVINVDGHGAGDPSLYDGLTPEEHEREILAMQDSAGMHDGPLEGDAEGLRGDVGALATERRDVDVVELPQFHHNAVLARGAKVVPAEIRRFIGKLA